MYSQVTIGEDHISRLPDDILSFILSFLSMRDAVKTRLLSHRWRRLCSSASNLHFDLLSVVGIEHKKQKKKILLEHKSKFVMGVNQFLQFYTSGPKIDTFQITYPFGNESASHVDEWISFATGILEAKTMSLDLSYCSDGHECYSFPCHLLPYYKTSCLRNLHLKHCMLAPSPDSAKRLNCLRTLNLSYVRLDQLHLDSILSGCLNLEFFKLDTCILPMTFRIFGPLLGLKSLTVCECDDLKNLELNSLEKLDFFKYSGLETHFRFIGVPALIKVYLTFINRNGRGTHYVCKKLAKDLPKLESLMLNFIPYQGIPIHASITTFKHLKQLELFISVSQRCDILSIQHILNASPALQKFHLGLSYSSSWRWINCRKLEGKYLHLQLREVEISGFSNKEKEMELLIYLLNNCIALKRMIVSSNDKDYLGNDCWEDWPGPGPSHSNLEMVRDLLVKQKVDSGVELIVV